MTQPTLSGQITVPFVDLNRMNEPIRGELLQAISALVDSGGFGRYIIDGLKVDDSVKVFAGALLVAVLAIVLELLLALIQRALTSPGLRSAGPVRMADLAGDPLVAATDAAL